MERHVTLILKLEGRVVNDEYTYLESVQPYVYLSGPMDRISEKEGRGWREKAKTLLTTHNLKAVDPYDFKKSTDDPKLLVKTDLHWILRSSGMIINASQNVVVWGSPMETLWAHMHRVINIAFVGDLHPSPWLSAHSKVVQTLDQAVECVAWEIHRL